MNIEEYIKAVNARLVTKENDSNKKVLVVNVCGKSKQEQIRLESFAREFKDEIVKELTSGKYDERNFTHAFQIELHNFYVAKQQEDKYNNELKKYLNGEIEVQPVKPENSLAEEYSKLSPQVKAYLRAESFAKCGTIKRKKAAKKAKERIVSLNNGSAEDYSKIIQKMEEEAKGD